MKNSDKNKELDLIQEISQLKTENLNLKNRIKKIIEELKNLYMVIKNKDNDTETDYSSSEEDEEWTFNTNY